MVPFAIPFGVNSGAPAWPIGSGLPNNGDGYGAVEGAIALINADLAGEDAAIAVSPGDLIAVPGDLNQELPELAGGIFQDDPGMIDLAIDACQDQAPDSKETEPSPAETGSIAELLPSELLIPPGADITGIIRDAPPFTGQETLPRNETGPVLEYVVPPPVDHLRPGDGPGDTCLADATRGNLSTWQEWLGAINRGQVKLVDRPGGSGWPTPNLGMSNQEVPGSINWDAPGEGLEAPPLATVIRVASAPAVALAPAPAPLSVPTSLSAPAPITVPATQSAPVPLLAPAARPALSGTKAFVPVTGSDISPPLQIAALDQAEGSVNKQSRMPEEGWDLLGRPNELMESETQVRNLGLAALQPVTEPGQPRIALNVVPDAPAWMTQVGEPVEASPEPNRAWNGSAGPVSVTKNQAEPLENSHPLPWVEPIEAPGAMPGTTAALQPVVDGPGRPLVQGPIPGNTKASPSAAVGAKRSLPESERSAAVQAAELSQIGMRVVPDSLAPAQSARRLPASAAEKPAPEPMMGVLRNLPDFATTLAAHGPDQRAPAESRSVATPEIPGEVRSNPMERAIAGQVARSLSGAKAGSDTVIVVRLTPPELGTVRIEIRSDRDGLNARLHAEDPAVRDSLERLLPTLRGDLRASDSRLTEISVAPQQNHRDDSQQQRSDPDDRGRSQDPQGQQRDPHRRRQAERFRKTFDLVGAASDE